MGWFYLAFAIVTELFGTLALKMSDGFSKPLLGLGGLVAYIVSLGGLTLALKTIDLSIAYAIWSGLGTTVMAIVGIVYFKESASLMKIGSIFLIIAGVVGLNLSSRTH
jgi:small multidrug resistance pump